MLAFSHAFLTLYYLSLDFIRFLRNLLQSRSALAAENLFLRKQLALYQERQWVGISTARTILKPSAVPSRRSLRSNRNAEPPSNRNSLAAMTIVSSRGVGGSPTGEHCKLGHQRSHSRHKHLQGAATP